MILCIITGYLLVSNLSDTLFVKCQRSTIICVAIKPSLAHLAIPLLFGHPELMWEEVKKILLIGVDAATLGCDANIDAATPTPSVTSLSAVFLPLMLPSLARRSRTKDNPELTFLFGQNF